MKRYITYCMVLFAMLFANCTTTTEGLDEAQVLIVSVDKIEMKYNGGRTDDIMVVSACDWKATSTEGWSWITPTKKSGSGETKFNLRLAENTTVDARTATITLSNSTYGISKNISVTQEAGKPFINPSKSAVTSTANGASVTVSIESNVDYLISSTENWCKLSSTSGSKGTKSLTITIEKSTVVTKRTAVIKVVNKEKNITKEITVTQEAFGPSLSVASTSISSPVEGVTQNVTIKGNISWAATCDASWVKLSPANATAGTSTLKVVVDPNATTASRSTTIKISNSEYSKTAEIKVTQEAFGPSLAINTTSISTTSAGASKNITIEGNISWSATCDTNWVTLTPENGSAGTSTLNIVVAKNEETTSRTAKITVVNNDYSITKEITVSQTALAPELEVSETAISANCASEVKQVAVTSNISWNATCEADWVSLSPANGTGSATLKVTIAANSTTQSRSTVVKVVNAKYGITKEIPVSQVAFNPTISVQDNTTLNVNFASGEQTIAVDANVDYTLSSNVDWITVSKVTSGVKLKYTANYDANVRSGQIVLTNEQHKLNVVISVTQAAFPSDNVIYYTTTDGGIAILGASVFGTAKVLSVTNENGVGIIRFDSPITTISANAFKGSTNLKTITIPTGVNVIGDSAFYGCSSLTSVSVPDSVTTIGTYAFYGCKALTSVSIPNGITSIGTSTFDGCSGITSIAIPIDVTSIGENAFQNCSNLTRVDIADLSAWCRITFQNAYANPLSNNANLYLNNTKVAELIIPSDITVLKNFVFYGCTSLTSVTIPNGVTSIQKSAFCYCKNITSATIPESVTKIVSYAFYSCSKLASVYCASTTPPTGDSDMFYGNASGRKIYVKPGCVSAYQSASYWSNYSSYISVVPYTVTKCTSLVITADDVDWDDTTTTIYYTAVVNATSVFGSHTGIEETGTATSSTFAQNTSTTSTKTRTISFTYHGVTDATTITQGKKPMKKYTVDLNSSWQKSTSVPNPNSSTYDGVYESYSNYGVNSSSAWMYINIQGYDTFTIYVRSNGEANYDYVKVYNLDSTTSVKMDTRGNSSSSTSISSYTAVTFSNISSGSHRIAIQYYKDSSQHSGTDRGYVLIPKNQ